MDFLPSSSNWLDSNGVPGSQMLLTCGSVPTHLRRMQSQHADSAGAMADGSQHRHSDAAQEANGFH